MKSLDARRIESTDAGFPEALAEDGGYRGIWAVGDVSILNQPLLGFFCSSTCPGDAVLRTYDLARALRDAGEGVIGGFHSPMEKECLDLLLRGDQPIVICPARSIENMLIPKAWRDLIAKGSLLVISPFGASHRQPKVQLANRRNRFVALLASSIFIAHAASGSKTEQFSEELIRSGKQVFLLDRTANDRLVQLGAKATSVTDLIPQLKVHRSASKA